MQRLPTANRLAPNQSGWGFFLCTEKSIRAGRGGDYVALTLQDATGEIVGRVLDNVERFRDEFDAGEFVKVQGRAQSFNGRLQFVIESSAADCHIELNGQPLGSIAPSEQFRSFDVTALVRPRNKLQIVLQIPPRESIVESACPILDVRLEIDGV